MPVLQIYNALAIPVHNQHHNSIVSIMGIGKSIMVPIHNSHCLGNEWCQNTTKCPSKLFYGIYGTTVTILVAVDTGFHI